VPMWAGKEGGEEMMRQRISGEKAMELFSLVKAKGVLQTPLQDLRPLAFIGQAAVAFYRQKIKLMNQLNVIEDQRKATLKDGQDAGEMLLDIEARIGELAAKEERAKPVPLKGRGALPSGAAPKHDRLGLTRKRMSQAEAIAKHPKIVEQVKAEARENEEIPRKTAVLKEIVYHEEKKRKKAADAKQKEDRLTYTADQLKYLSMLHIVLSEVTSAKLPKRWDEKAFAEAKRLAKIIIGRLEVFNEKTQA